MGYKLVKNSDGTFRAEKVQVTHEISESDNSVRDVKDVKDFLPFKSHPGEQEKIKIENKPDFPDILDTELDFPTQFDIDNLPSKCYLDDCYCKGFSWIKSRWQCEKGHRQPEITCDQKS
jgi:hypothetical protein